MDLILEPKLISWNDKKDRCIISKIDLNLESVTSNEVVKFEKYRLYFGVPGLPFK